jgi:hypothetical protein
VDAVIPLAAAAVSALAPALRHLLQRGGDRAADEVGSKLGSEAWNEAKKLWAKLGPKIEERPSSRETAEKLATSPDDEDLKAALRVHVREILSEDRGLRDEVNQIINSNIKITRTTTQQGEGNIYVERGDVTQRFDVAWNGTQQGRLPRNPIARVLMLLGATLCLAGLGIVGFSIFTISDHPDPDSGFPTAIPIGAGVFFGGFVLAAVGGVIGQLTAEHDK